MPFLKNPLAFDALELVGQHVWPRTQPGTTGLSLLEYLCLPDALDTSAKFIVEQQRGKHLSLIC